MRTIRLGDIPTIKQGNKLFSLSELIGKPIVANEETIAYKFPSEKSKIYFIILIPRPLENNRMMFIFMQIINMTLYSFV